MIRALFLLALGVAALFIPSPARADFVRTTTLLGSNEWPVPVSTTGTGTATVSYSDSTALISLILSYSNLEGTSLDTSGIFVGTPGSNGARIFRSLGLPSNHSGVFFRSFGATDFSPAPAFGINNYAQAIQSLQNGGMYFQLRSSSFLNGELRGQLDIVPVPEPGSLVLLVLGLALGIGLTARRRLAQTADG